MIHDQPRWPADLRLVIVPIALLITAVFSWFQGFRWQDPFLLIVELRILRNLRQRSSEVDAFSAGNMHSGLQTVKINTVPPTHKMAFVPQARYASFHLRTLV